MATYEVTVSGTSFNVSIAQLANAEITAKVTEAQTAASNAATSETNAAASATSAANTYDSFDDRYLGAKASAPAVDNDGDALLVGALYFDTGLNEMRGWTGSAWVSTATTFDSANANITGGTINVTEVTAAQYNSTEALPDIKPSLNLDFANTKALDPRITYTRGSTATYYDGKTFAKAEENLFLQSQFASGWANFGTNSITANNAAAPDGTTTAALVSSPDATDYVYQIPTTTIGLTYVFSFFVKNSTATVSRYLVRTGSTAAIGTLVWSGATLSSVTPTVGTASFADVGNGWYRVSVFYTAIETDARHRIGGGDNVSAPGNIYLWGAQLEQRSALTDYTATTTQPITNYVPALQTAASGEPRFDHDPITGESKGFLIEEQRTNLLTYSEQFDNAAWGKDNSSITANTVVAPDGTLTADKLVENTASSFHRVNSTSASVTSGLSYTTSVFVKAAEKSRFSITAGGANFNFLSVAFDLSAETAGSGGQIEPVGNGWYRCTITTTASGTGAGRIDFELNDASGNRSYTGDGYSGIYLWGASLEQGSFPTSYIKTEASQVTRSPDAASMTGTNFSSWYRQDEGSFFSEFSRTVGIANSFVLHASNGSINNGMFLYTDGAPQLKVIFRYNNLAQATFNFLSGVGTDGQVYKESVAYKVDDFAGSHEGQTALTDTSGVIASVNALYVGQFTNSQYLNGHIKKIAFYPKRLSNDTLQALTEE